MALGIVNYLNNHPISRNDWLLRQQSVNLPFWYFYDFSNRKREKQIILTKLEIWTLETRSIILLQSADLFSNRKLNVTSK